MTSYTAWPPLFGIKIIDQLSDDGFYTIPRSQTIVFPFRLMNGVAAVQVDAGHTTFYGNQQGTIRGWASNEIKGRSISADTDPALSSINLQGDGYHWLYHRLDVDIKTLDRSPDLPEVDQAQWVYPDRPYFMCFQNLENKDNGLYARFTYITW